MDESAQHDASPPRVFIETYGCQMNVADSELVTAVLRRAGYASADRPEDADVILLNTCAIREHAEERVLGRLSDSGAVQARAPRSARSDCSDAWRSTIAPRWSRRRRTSTWSRVPTAIGGCPKCSARARFDPQVDVRLDRAETYADIAPAHAGRRARLRHRDARMRQVLRLLRGALRARTRAQRAARGDLSREIRGLAARGVREVDAARADGQRVSLRRHRLRRAAADGRARSTASSESASPRRIHRDMSDSVIDAMATEPKVQPYSASAGAVGIGSRYSPRWNAAIPSTSTSRWSRSCARAIPGLALSTDIIVGFHGEDDADFRATLDADARGRLRLAPSPSSIRCAKTPAPSSSATR